MKTNSNSPRAGIAFVHETLLILLCVKMGISWIVIGLVFLAGWLINLVIAIAEHYNDKRADRESKQP